MQQFLVLAVEDFTGNATRPLCNVSAIGGGDVELFAETACSLGAKRSTVRRAVGARCAMPPTLPSVTTEACNCTWESGKHVGLCSGECVRGCIVGTFSHVIHHVRTADMTCGVGMAPSCDLCNDCVPQSHSAIHFEYPEPCPNGVRCLHNPLGTASSSSVSAHTLLCMCVCPCGVV